MDGAPIIILNGVGSAGKTSTARALQTLTAQPFLHVQMDAFLEMMPQAMFGHPDGLVFETVPGDGPPSIAIHGGPVMARTLAGMRHAVAAMAGQGNALIVDDVVLGAEDQRAWRDALAAFDVRFVGLFAPLEVLEARERARGDRAIGLARWQVDRVHAGLIYDLEIDTTAGSPSDNAARIQAAFGL